MDFEDPHSLRAATRKMKIEYLEGARGASISVQQAATLKAVPVKGPFWVSKFTTPKTKDNDSRELLLNLVDEANKKNIRYDRPVSEPLKLQWTGYRKDATKDTPEPSLSEEEKYQKLASETKSSLTILYIYGGSFVFNTPAKYRKISGSLARMTGGKVLMVHQRLAPQHPFPAALLDVFQAYLTLLAPPPGSPHQAIPPSSIVMAGDSSGACLCLGVLQVLLRLGKRCSSVNFHGKMVRPLIPAGVALLSVVADLTNSLPSYEGNTNNDIFPVPIENLPYLEKSFPTCPIWPAKPARANLYCEAGMLAHPLASPAASTNWYGSCPLWFASGQEQLADPARLVAQTACMQAVSVTLQEYEAMPHTFFWVFTQAPQTRKILMDWAEAIISFAKRAEPSSKATLIRAKGLQSEEMDINNLVPFAVDEAREMMFQKTLAYKVPLHHQQGKSSL